MIGNSQTEAPTLDDLLLSHAAGYSPEPLAVLIESHLELRPKNRRMLAQYEAIGGEFFDQIEGRAISERDWELLQSRIGAGPPASDDLPDKCANQEPDLPLPLRRILKGPIENLPWKQFGALFETSLDIRGEQDFTTRLISLKAGMSAPRHTHTGVEITLVLRGAFSDAEGIFERGDVVIADGQTDHRPKAAPKRDCLCLTVSTGGFRLTGPIGRLFNPFLSGH